MTAPADAPSTPSAPTQLTQDSISALEYLTQQEELGNQSHHGHTIMTVFLLLTLSTESSARDILPYSFERCTAPLGHLRQSLYSCLTCSPLEPETQRGGICYSCSIQCHGSHNLVELFNKRDFVCDCGTTRMGPTPCSLRKVAKQEPASGNRYDHNFDGRFCACDVMYDPVVETGTMFQCLVCEDWFHEKCIGEETMPSQEDFDVFVCQGCVGKYEWLRRYVANREMCLSTLERYPELKVDVETVQVEISGPLAPPPSASRETVSVKRTLSPQPVSPQQSKRVKVEQIPDKDFCKWSILPSPPSTPFALFLQENFRDHLCRCDSCSVHRLSTLPMLSTEEETYEPDEDTSDTDSLLDAGTKALESLPRTQALNGIVAYQALSTKLKTFFQGFVQTGRVVTSDDVHGFFAEINASKGAVVGDAGIEADGRNEESAR